MTHIQKAVQSVDDRGKYQFVLVGILIFIYLELGLILLGSSFIYMNPTWDCPQISSPTEDEACRNPLCRITNDFTATHYANLYCDGQDARSLIQSAPYIGSIIGLLLLTPFADSKGKKKIFVLSQCLMIVGITLNLIGVYAKTAAVIVVGQIILGSGCYSVLIIGYVIISELAEDKFKQYSITILNAVWALTQVLISGFYFWFNFWRNYLLFIQLIPNIILLVLAFFYFVESPYFLIEKMKDLEGAMTSMRKIAAVNGVGEQALVTVEQQLKLALEEVEQREKEEAAKHANTPKIDPRFAIFKDWKHLKILLVVAVFEFGANAYYYGVQFSLGQIGTDFGYNILLTGLIESTAFFTSNLFITKVPRRMGGLGFNLICIVLGLLFFFDFGMVAQTVLLGVCRFFNTYTNAIVPMMQNEPFPHHYRSVAWGYIEGISQIGNFITPYIVTACQNASINPLIVFSFMLSVIGTVPLLFYRETQGISEDQLVAIEEQEEKAEHNKESIQTDGSMEGPLLRDSNNKDL